MLKLKPSPSTSISSVASISMTSLSPSSTETVAGVCSGLVITGASLSGGATLTVKSTKSVSPSESVAVT